MCTLENQKFQDIWKLGIGNYFPLFGAAAGGSTHVAYTRSSQIAPISPNTTTELQELRKSVGMHSGNILANRGAREARPCLQTRAETSWPGDCLENRGDSYESFIFLDKSAVLQISECKGIQKNTGNATPLRRAEGAPCPQTT